MKLAMMAFAICMVLLASAGRVSAEEAWRTFAPFKAYDRAPTVRLPRS